jgi:putative ABC transport system permease protein
MTCDGSFVLGGCLASILARNGVSPAYGCLLAFVGGAAAGWTTAFLHNRYKIADILAGILVAFMLYSLNLRLLGGTPNVILEGSTVGNGTLLLVCLGAVAAVSYLLNTDFGLALRAIGQNRLLAKASGMNVAAMVAFGVSLGNGLIGLGGAFFCLTQGFCDIGNGIGTLIVAMASLIIGERILPFRSQTVAVAACVIGSVIYRVLVGFALHGNFGFFRSSDFNLITGLLIVTIMAIGRNEKCST